MKRNEREWEKGRNPASRNNEPPRSYFVYPDISADP
jgi:hypothetical protein